MTLLQWSYGTSFEGGAPLDEPLVSDRPDFTEASTTVGRGVSQLEMGYTFISDDDGAGRLRAHSFPEALLRVGAFAEWFEFRFGYKHGRDKTTTGAGTAIDQTDALYLGIKLGLTPQEGILPEMALVPQMVRTSSNQDRIEPGVNWLYGWDINDWLSTGGSSQFNRRYDDTTAEPYIEFVQSWTVGYALLPKTSAYTEWFCLVPNGADTDQTQHYFNGGLVYSVTDNLQLDVRAGIGLSRASDDFFGGVGLVTRF